MLLPGKSLLISVLPHLTRPSADDDRAAIADFSSARGFDLLYKDPGRLEYVSPPFELEALKSEGLDLPTWRSGDLCIHLFCPDATRGHTSPSKKKASNYGVHLSWATASSK